MAGTKLVEIVILDAPGAGGCSCGSSPAFGNPEYTRMLQSMCQDLCDALEKAFPGQTTVVYRALPDHPAERDTPAGRVLVDRTYPPPLVVIDGEPRFAGSIPTAKIVEAVGAALGT